MDYQKLKDALDSPEHQPLGTKSSIYRRNIGLYKGKFRYLLLIIAEIQMLFVSGIVFGWQPLENTMIEQKEFLYLCEKNETSCTAQSLRLNLVYTIGTFTVTGSAFITGYIFDKYGPRITNLLGYIIMVIGCVMWYVAHITNSNLYILSFALIGIGGPASQVSLLHIANLFPKMSQSIQSSFSGVFVGSSFIFKLFNIIATKYNIEISTLFLYYIIVITVLFLPSIVLMGNIPYIPLDEIDRLEHVEQQQQQQSHIQSPIIYNNNKIDIKERSAFRQCLSWQFILLILFMSLNSLHEIYFIGIINDLYEDNAFYIDFFNYSWNGGLLLVPIVGFVMLKSKLYMNALLVILSGIIFGVISLVPVTKLQPVGFVFISLQNVYLWAFFFTYLSDIFGYTNFGKLMGVSSVATALFGLLEYLLVDLTLNTSLGFFWLNLILTLSKFPLLYFPYKLWNSYKTQHDYSLLS